MNRLKNKYVATLFCLFLTAFVFGNTVTIYSPADIPEIQFAIGDLKKAIKREGSSCQLKPFLALADKKEGIQLVLGTLKNEKLQKKLNAAGGKVPDEIDAEGFTIQITRNDNLETIWAIGADATGAMYAGLDLAETIAMDGILGIQEKNCNPYIKKRGLKMNIPLDARTPSFADCGDAAQNNIEVVWDMDFWTAHLDALARFRYNTITLWIPHPFPSLVKVPEYPDIALNDVKVADIDWQDWFSEYAGGAGANSVNDKVLDNLKTVKKITIDEKIEFWREVMQYAHHRGIEFHFITWNIFTWAANGKYGITPNIENEASIDYLRKSVRTLIETYPLLAGIGVTAGENMKHITPDDKEQWLWKTYGMGLLDAKKAFPDRKIRFIHRYWQSKIPEITKHFDGFDEDIEFNFSFKYAKARLYSNTNPTFVDPILKEAPKRTKWWWNLRNDDIFYFRWGDPDYVREFINNLPPYEQTEGFHMGSDGYVWGREFVSTEPETPRQLEVEKHWYKYMLWGRLGYSPTLTNEFFEKEIQERFPGKPTQLLQQVWASSSKIIPAVNREHWHDWDFQWAVEACRGRISGYHAITDKCWLSGGTTAADEIQGYANFVLKKLPELKQTKGDKTWQRTLGDIEAMAHLGNYYAEKMRAADNKAKNVDLAIVHLVNAAEHWKKYAKIGKRQYKSQLLSRAGWADWDTGYENALKDIELLKESRRND